MMYLCNTIKNNKTYLVFSGIGNPNTFKKTLLINKIRITKSIVFPDHYHYRDGGNGEAY